MGSRLRNFFLGNKSSGKNGQNKKTISKPNPNLRGQSYDTTVASEPPLKGSFPVAGNGPNVVEEMQRAHAKRQSTTGSIAAARPQTAPSNGTGSISGGRWDGYSHTNGDRGRTFSMKSRTSIFHPNRRDSVRSISNSTEHPPLPLQPSPPQPRRPSRDIQTYQPTGAFAVSTNSTPPVPPIPPIPIPEGFTPPFAQHNRASSRASYRSHVDLLDAQSNINPSRDHSKHRAKASGYRNYGEDVADRNIPVQVEKENRLDINAPEFSYLKSVYSPKNAGAHVAKLDSSHSRAASALGHVLGPNTGNGDSHDDTQIHIARTATPTHAKTASIRSATVANSRPSSVLPPRTDSVSVPPGSIRGYDDARPSASNGVQVDQRGRAMSSLSTATSYEPPARDPRRGGVYTTRALSSPAQARGQLTHNPPPVPAVVPATLPSAVPSQPVQAPPFHARQPSNTSASRHSDKRRNMSTASARSAGPVNGGTKSRNGSVSYSAFPNTSQIQKETTPRAVGENELPHLKGIVDLNNTVDTDVTTKVLPAVTHEHVTPTRREIREEVITREIHTHDVYHRILPVLETEVLPAKHYVPSADGKGLVEIPEGEVPGRTITGSPHRNWKIVDNGKATGGNRTSTLSRPQSSDLMEEEGADAPVIALARGEPRAAPKTRARGNSLISLASSKSKGKSLLEPILSSKKEYVSKEGHPKTEYVWHHPPVFEDAEGRTQPVYIGAGLGDISGSGAGAVSKYSDEDDEFEEEMDGKRHSARGEEELVFRDSGYGSGGMLPGLMDRSPLAASIPRKRVGSGVHENGSEEVGKMGKVKVASNAEGEATKALRRMKEKRHLSETGNGVSELSDGVRGLSVRE